MNVKDAIAGAEALQKASPASLAELNKCGVLKAWAKGAHLFFDKDDVRTVYFVVSGLAALYKVTALQDRKVIFIYGSGQMLNEVILQDLPASVNCELLEDSWILSFPKDLFLQVMSRDFSLTKAVLDSMAMKIRRLYRQMQNSSTILRSDKRLAAKLWKLSRDHGAAHARGVEIALDLSVTYLADLMGAKRETISRQLKLLAGLGLIHCSGKRIVIADRERLLQYFQGA